MQYRRMQINYVDWDDEDDGSADDIDGLEEGVVYYKVSSYCIVSIVYLKNYVLLL